MIRTARDWLLRRFLQFLLRRALGKYLRAGDLDLDQIEVKLDSGCLEIKSVLIDCDVLNKDLVRLHAWPSPHGAGVGVAYSHGIICMIRSTREGRPNWWPIRRSPCCPCSSEYPRLGGQSPTHRERQGTAQRQLPRLGSPWELRHRSGRCFCHPLPLGPS